LLHQHLDLVLPDDVRIEISLISIPCPDSGRRMKGSQNLLSVIPCRVSQQPNIKKPALLGRDFSCRRFVEIAYAVSISSAPSGSRST
jgi:hypothetical protein